MKSIDITIMYWLLFPILVIIGYYFGRYVVLKSLLNTFRTCIDRIDDALKDNNVSEEEFKKIWDTCYEGFIDFLPPKMPPVAPQK